MSLDLLEKPAALKAPALRISDLNVAYDGRRTVHGASFEIGAGEVVALVGESGSGKSTIAQSVIGLLPEGGRVEAGRILIGEQDVSGWSDRRFDTIRGAVVGLIPQDPGASLNPVLTIGAQIAEVFRLHGRRDRAGIRAEVLALLEKVGLNPPDLRYGQYPHELSGGMKQRALIAAALALKPALIIADEPTSALDVTVQKRILDLIDELRAETGAAVLLVTHDLAMAADRADRIVVLQGGRIREQGPTREIFAAPKDAYTRRLLADAPALSTPRIRRALAEGAETAVLAEGLRQEFPTAQRGSFCALNGVSFEVARGSTHALVGESGSGKTTAVRAAVGLRRPQAGRLIVNGQDVTKLEGEALRQFRRSVQLVYQNPFASLDPRQTARAAIEEPLLNYAPVPSREARARRVEAVFERVGLARDLLDRRPAALSGGQRQRVAIARALILDPSILVLDEAVSALDVTVQAQILRLLDELQRDLGLTYLFVSHDLAVVRAISDTATVLRGGEVVENGPVERLFAAPQSEYLRDLIAAIPGASLRPPQEGAAS